MALGIRIAEWERDDIEKEIIMQYVLSKLIIEHNVRPHLDIERDIQSKKNGLFTFNLRINKGEIEDYSQFETIDVSQYAGVLFTVVQERQVPCASGSGSPKDAVRPVVSQRGN